MASSTEDISCSLSSVPSVDVDTTTERQAAGRDAPSSSQAASSSQTSSKKAPKKHPSKAPSNTDDDPGCALFMMTYQVFIVLVLLMGLAFAYENATRNYTKVVLGAFGIEGFFFIALLFAYCQGGDAASVISFVGVSVIMGCEAGFLGYVMYSDHTDECTLNGCSVLKGTFYYRFVFVSLLAMFLVIHLIGYVGGIVHMLPPSSPKKKPVVKARTKSGSRSRRSRSRSSRSRSQSRTRSQTSQAGPTRIIHQKILRARVVTPSPSATSGQTTGSTFVPVSRRGDQSEANSACPVVRGACTISSCPYYSGLPHMQAQIAHQQAAQAAQPPLQQPSQVSVQQLVPHQVGSQQLANNNSARPMVIDVPANIVSNGGAIDVTRCDTSRVIIRMPGQAGRVYPDAQEVQGTTYRTTVTPMISNNNN